MLKASTLRFLKDLKKNNNKPWFDANRNSYEAARKDFEIFIQSLIDKFSKSDDSLSGLTAKECMFRINRDIRFSKDKSPYKTNFGASINRGGKKSFFAGYYFHLEPGESFAGGGLWSPMPQELNKVRQEIDYCFDEFKKITGSKKFRTTYSDLYQDGEIKLLRLPKGYEQDNPAGEYLKLKSFIAMKNVPDVDLQEDKLQKSTVEAFQTLQPLVNFLNRALAI